MSDKGQLLQLAEQALQSLYRTRNSLNDARALGAWDMFGGGILTSVFKHDKLDEAKKLLTEARQDLQRLQQGLREQNLDLTADWGISGNLQFFDIFLDNIFSDIMVQDKIKSAQADIERAIQQLQELIAKLRK